MNMLGYSVSSSTPSHTPCSLPPPATPRLTSPPAQVNFRGLAVFPTANNTLLAFNLATRTLAWEAAFPVSAFSSLQVGRHHDRWRAGRVICNMSTRALHV